MLSIKREVVERDVRIEDLFHEVGVVSDENVELGCEFELSVLSWDGSGDCFRAIEGFRCTEPLNIHRLELVTTDGKRLALDAASTHLVMTGGWVWKHIRDLTNDDVVWSSEHGWCDVNETWTTPAEPEVMFDLQVAETHCFYAGGILSHNSHFLVQMGANAMRAGKNVLHYTFELRENKVGIRYDSNFCGISATDIPNERDFVHGQYKKLGKLGRLIIKEYPTNSATVMTLRSHIEKLAITKNFRPDIIIVDYADIMRSTRQYDSLRHELKLVYEELRGLAMDLGIPIWSASQSNRDSTDSEVVGLDKISESFGKAMVCDFIVTLSRKPLQKSNGLGNLFIPKNRMGKDGILFPVKVDTARSIIEILDKNIDFEEFQKTHDNSMKKLIADKWREVAEDRLTELRDAAPLKVAVGDER